MYSVCSVVIKLVAALLLQVRILDIRFIHLFCHYRFYFSYCKHYRIRLGLAPAFIKRQDEMLFHACIRVRTREFPLWIAFILWRIPGELVGPVLEPCKCRRQCSTIAGINRRPSAVNAAKNSLLEHFNAERSTRSLHHRELKQAGGRRPSPSSRPPAVKLDSSHTCLKLFTRQFPKNPPLKTTASSF